MVEAKERTTAPKASRKNIVWIEEQPAVALCDISQNFDALSQDCSYTLPDVLRTKVVRCFKQEMRAGFRFEPGRSGRNKNRNGQSSLAKSQQSCAPVPSQGPTPPYQTPLQERTWPWSVHGAGPSSDSWTRFKCAKEKGSRTVLLAGGASADPGLEGAQSLSNRKTEKVACKPPVRVNTGANRGDQWEHLPGRSGTQFSDEVCTPTNADGAGMSPQVCRRGEAAGADRRTDTCQRARVYFRKNHFSCARTDTPWPRPRLKRGLARALRTAMPTCAALRAEPPDTGSSPRREGALSRPPPGSTQRINQQEDEGRDGFLTGGSGERPGNRSARSPDSSKVQGGEAQTRPPSHGPGVHGRESSAHINSPLPSSGHQWGWSGTPPPPSAAVRSSMERTSSFCSMSPPPSAQPRGGSTVSPDGASSPYPNTQSLEKRWCVSEGAQMIPCSPRLAAAPSCDSFHSSESSLLLPQDRPDCDGEPLSRSPTLLPNYGGSPTDDKHDSVHALLCGTCGGTANALPPMLSPIISPDRRFWRSLLSWSPGSSERAEEQQEQDDDICSHKALQLVHGNSGRSSVDLQHGFEGSGEALERQCAPSSQSGPEPSSPSTCADVSSHPLDEVSAYKQDILLVDVTQDDAELFENVPQESLLKLGPVRFSEELKRKPLGTAKKQQLNSDAAPAALGQR